jgi:hypothetical protein
VCGRWLVTGHTQAVDSAFVKANASLESLCEKQPADASTPVLHVSGESAPDTAAQSAVPVSSPEHHLRQVATAHAVTCATIAVLWVAAVPKRAC